MVDAALGRARLVAQGLITRPFAKPVEVARAFAASQAQDLPGVVASLALRTADGSVEAVLEAFEIGQIVRGYPMRGTVFLTAAADLGWITELCAPAMIRQSERIMRNRDLTPAILERATGLAIDELADGPVPRARIAEVWQEAGVAEIQGSVYHMLTHGVMSGTFCYGPLRDGDHHVALCETWLPAGGGLEERFNGDRDAATAELLLRYLSSRGPATLRDFAWWSKLTLTQIRRAHALIADQLEDIGEERYQRIGLSDEVAVVGRAASRPVLLPGFDEFILGYQDRLFALTEADHPKLVPGNNGVFRRSAVAGGRVVGFWKLAGTPARRRLDLTPLIPLAPRTAATFEKLFATFPFLSG